jgi:putative DNA primase/helicase
VEPFDPARDMPALQAEADRIGQVRLLIVDPVVSAVTGDSHKNTETRRSLQPLVDMAGRMNAALLGITHFSKGGQGSDPAQRVLGSVAFTAVARVVLVAAKVQAEDGKDRRILARGKSNIGPDDGGYEYHLEQVVALPGISASRVSWGAAVEGSARELLTDPNDDDEGEQSAVAGAREFLQEVLRDCPIWSKDIQGQAKEAGISWRTVRRASDEMNIIKQKGQEGRWYWKLPNLKAGHVVQGVQTSNVGQVGQVGQEGAVLRPSNVGFEPNDLGAAHVN